MNEISEGTNIISRIVLQGLGSTPLLGDCNGIHEVEIFRINGLFPQNLSLKKIIEAFIAGHKENTVKCALCDLAFEPDFLTILNKDEFTGEVNISKGMFLKDVLK